MNGEKFYPSHPTHPLCPRKPHHARPWNIGLSSPTARPVTELSQISQNTILQERLKAAEAKRIEKERTEKYNKLKTDAKDARAKYREKVKEKDEWVYREKSILLVQASRESSKVWCRRGIRIWRWGGRFWAQQESGAGSNGP